VGQNFIKGIANSLASTGLLSWLQISEVDLHKENVQEHSSVNADIALPDSAFGCERPIWRSFFQAAAQAREVGI
jgi:hypothetical protein